MQDDNQIIRGCKKHKRSAQEALYKKYAPVLRGICLRYSSNIADAEDLLQEGFIKILSKIGQFSGSGSFEGWLKRIMVNSAISHFRQLKYHYNIDDINQSNLADENESDDEKISIKSQILNAEISKDELLSIVNSLPDGFRIVFNMYVIEEFSHKEIAQALTISESTSKSQLSRARKLIQKKLIEICNLKQNKN